MFRLFVLVCACCDCCYMKAGYTVCDVLLCAFVIYNCYCGCLFDLVWFVVYYCWLIECVLSALLTCVGCFKIYIIG